MLCSLLEAVTKIFFTQVLCQGWSLNKCPIWAASAHISRIRSFGFCFVLSWDTVSLCSSDWPQTLFTLPRPPPCWDHRYVPTNMVQMFFSIPSMEWGSWFSFASYISKWNFELWSFEGVNFQDLLWWNFRLGSWLGAWNASHKSMRTWVPNPRIPWLVTWVCNSSVPTTRWEVERELLCSEVCRLMTRFWHKRLRKQSQYWVYRN